MTPLSPALLELMSKVVNGDASGDELLRQIESMKSEAVPQGSGAVADDLDVVRCDPAHGIPAQNHPIYGGPAEGAAQGAADRACPIPGATVDLGRATRCGFGEVVYGEGKSAELVARIIRTQLDAGQSALVTRIDSGVAFQVRQCFEFAYHNPIARTLRVTPLATSTPSPLTPQQAGGRIHAAVVTAGSTDGPVAEEAVETLHWMGVPVQRFEDIGVAGPHRLTAALPSLRLASAVVVVAGMEGALPAVISGHLAVPVFAVPTSVGYGANLGGLTTLMSMLTTCSASVAVVNIDSGFKGGYMAGLVIRQLEQVIERAGATVAGTNRESEPHSENDAEARSAGVGA